MIKYHQGKYIPKVADKYVGNPTNITYRSSWELKFMIWCDTTSSVIKWMSEETVIPYRCGTDNKIHRYFLDFQIQVLNKNNVLQTYLVEIKPDAQTKMPVFPGKQTKRYITESMTFVKNQSKWKAAEQYAEDRGWKFIILTEYHLGIKR